MTTGQDVAVNVLTCKSFKPFGPHNAFLAVLAAVPVMPWPKVSVILLNAQLVCLNCRITLIGKQSYLRVNGHS